MLHCHYMAMPQHTKPGGPCNLQRISDFKTWLKNPKKSKIKIVFIVWSQCYLQYFKSYTNKLPMFNIEYLSSYNLSFRVGV